jgi:hypothetical protein
MESFTSGTKNTTDPCITNVIATARTNISAFKNESIPSTSWHHFEDENHVKRLKEIVPPNE